MGFCEEASMGSARPEVASQLVTCHIVKTHEDTTVDYETSDDLQHC